jgi:hypothetical protein
MALVYQDSSVVFPYTIDSSKEYALSKQVVPPGFYQEPLSPYAYYPPAAFFPSEPKGTDSYLSTNDSLQAYNWIYSSPFFPYSPADTANYYLIANNHSEKYSNFEKRFKPTNNVGGQPNAIVEQYRVYRASYISNVYSVSRTTYELANFNTLPVSVKTFRECAQYLWWSQMYGTRKIVGTNDNVATDTLRDTMYEIVYIRSSGKDEDWEDLYVYELQFSLDTKTKMISLNRKTIRIYSNY